MKKGYDFSNGIKNPYFEGLKNGYKIIIHHDSADGGWDEVVEVTPEEVSATIEKINTHRKEFAKK